MKKFSLIFMFSFICYIPGFHIINNSDPVDEWQKWIWLLVPASYQLLFIFYLRKKEAVSFSRSIAKSFFFHCCVAEILAIIFYINVFFNGYRVVEFIGLSTVVFPLPEYRHEIYYGFEAWSRVGQGFLNTDALILPIVILCIIYQICYLVISKIIKIIKQKSNTTV